MSFKEFGGNAMALNGTLSDLGIIDLIQFPGAGRKTGELIVAGLEDEARLYYLKGKLKHVSLNDMRGVEAMVDLVSWKEGEFEFRLGVETEEQSIEIDLHRALMQALKMRDEREEELRKNKTDTVAHEAKGPSVEATRKVLHNTVSTTDFVQCAAVLTPSGEIISQVAVEEIDEQQIVGIAGLIADIGKSYARDGLKRVLFTDSAGTVLAERISSGVYVMLVAGNNASLGSASMNATKLAAAIEEL
ncbi:MAG: DUF4388 domain-containing protein [Deltaproteobacteria bacterium]|nr:DUF4388 domain-containing protein [Deltaproteobacteria bacterium]